MTKIPILFFVFLFVCPVYSQSVNKPIYYIDNDSIITTNDFIDKWNNEFYKDIKPYTVINTISVISLDGKYKYDIILNRYNGWEGEAGDFQSVDIKISDKSILQFDNQDGWVKLPSALCPVNGVSQYFVHLDDKTSLLYFVGYAYNSCPGFLTLVLLRKEQAKVVFNKEFVVDLIEKTANSFSIYLKDGFNEYIDGSTKPINNPSKFKIINDSGVLKFIGPSEKFT